jgi:hypothetical protein
MVIPFERWGEQNGGFCLDLRMIFKEKAESKRFSGPHE